MKDYPTANLFNVHENLIEALLELQAYADVQALLVKYDGLYTLYHLRIFAMFLSDFSLCFCIFSLFSAHMQPKLNSCIQCSAKV